MIFVVKYGVGHQYGHQARLETLESLKTPVDENIDPLERASKENNDVELGEEKDFGDEASAVVSATFSISSVTPIQKKNCH